MGDTELSCEHPGIARSWYPRSEQVSPCFSCAETVRKAIHTTNALKSWNRSVRRAVATRGHFRSDWSIARPIYMALRKAERQWRRPPLFWQPARWKLTILFPNRFQVVPR